MYAFNQGASAEEIVMSYPRLELGGRLRGRQLLPPQPHRG
ncbi:MAG TPA: hypothetical protein VKN18_05730 [Blastocatellia bacterium]|nr:hypothetical protein [Blastocatellia bacterium]